MRFMMVINEGRQMDAGPAAPAGDGGER